MTTNTPKNIDSPASPECGKHVAGGRRGKERAARHERSSEWRRGAAGSPDPTLAIN